MPHDSRFSRREFLQAGALSAGAVGLSLSDLAAFDAGGKDVNCILLFLVGGPSHLDTFDLKPDAPENVRGPFRPIRTSVPGVAICEHFPRTAAMAERFAILRSMHHDAAPIHETGHQLMQTGRLFRNGTEYPHYGATLSYLKGERRSGAKPFVVLPGPIDHTGVSVSHGQTAGSLGKAHGPAFSSESLNSSPEDDRLLERYGGNTFGRSCLAARKLVERGTRLVTVNMFETVFNNVTWDCHADGGGLATTLDDYATTLCPTFDMAYSALLDDLHQRGMLDTTLVLAMGEFGRTPHLNPRGGRDHWTGCWSVLFAGAGVRGGQVVGASDRLGGEPKDRPATPADLAATVYRALGLNPAARIAGPYAGTIPLSDGTPIRELLA